MTKMPANVVIGQLSSSHGFDQPNWAAATQAQMNHQYSRHNSHPGFAIGPYWLSNNGPPAMAYQQQQFSLTTTSGAHGQDPQIAYSNQGLGDARHQTQRQSFSGLSNGDMSTSPNAYRHHSATFPDIERSMTMPIVYSHSGPHADVNMHGSPSLGTGMGQYPFNGSVPPQVASNHSGSSWFSHSSPPQAFASPYLPSHVDRQA